MRGNVAVLVAVVTVGFFAASSAVAASTGDAVEGPPGVSYHQDCVDYVVGNGSLVECLRICFSDGSGTICTI